MNTNVQKQTDYEINWLNSNMQDNYTEYNG